MKTARERLDNARAEIARVLELNAARVERAHYKSEAAAYREASAYLRGLVEPSGDTEHEADRASRGTGERAVEPPAGHLEVAVRALEEIREHGRLKKLDPKLPLWWCEACDVQYGEAIKRGKFCHLNACLTVIASRALAALRTAPAGECRRFHCGHAESEHGLACSAPGCRCKSFLAAALDSAGDAGTGDAAHNLGTTGATMYCIDCGKEWDLPLLAGDGCPGRPSRSTPTTTTKGEP